jgi:hypothetical protein
MVSRYQNYLEESMSMDEHKQKIGIPETHQLVSTQESKWEQRKGQDTDTYWYDHVDEAGTVIAKYIVKDSTSMYPPCTRSITYEKIG